MLGPLILLSQLLACRVALEVEVTVEAAWPAASLAAELLEGLSQLDRGAAFLRSLAEADVEPGSFRQSAVHIAEKLLCCQGHSVYGRLLSLRARHAFASAVVEAARGMERADRAVLEEHKLLSPKTCGVGDPWVLLQWPSGLRVVCGDDLERLTDMVNDPVAVDHVSVRGAPRHSGLDHLLYESESNDGEDSYIEICGYADLGDPKSASKLLGALGTAADLLQAQGKTGRVIFRHATPGGSPPPALLGGFGLELMTRSADEVAKSTDNDTDQSSGGSSHSDSSCLNEVADPAESFHGVDISMIAKNFPSGSSALCQLRGDLVAEAEKPPLPWELTRLGAHAALRTKQMAENGPLRGLQAMGEVAQDYPSGWARALSASADSTAARDLMAFAEDIKAPDSLQVNGWQVPLKQRGILPLLRASLPLFRAVELLASSGLSQSLALDLLRDAKAGGKTPSKVDTGDPRLGHDTVSFDLGGRKVVGVGLMMDLCNTKQLKFVLKVLANKPPALVWLRFESPREPALAVLMQLSLNEMMKLKSSSEATKLLKRFSKRKDQDLCDKDAADRIKQSFKELSGKEAPDVDADASRFRLPFPVPSASLNGRILAGLDVLERTLEQEIQRELEMISFTFMQFRRRVEQVPLQQITNLAYGPRYLHPMLLQMEPKVLTAWYPGISATSPRHVPLDPDLLASLPHIVAPATAEALPVVYLVVLGAADPLKLVQDAAEILSAFHSLWSLSLGEQPTRYLHLVVPSNCSATATVSSTLSSCLNLAMQKGTTALKHLAEAFEVLMEVTPEKLQGACREVLGHSDMVENASCQVQSPILKETGTDTALWVNGRLYGPLNLDGSLNSAILQHAEQLDSLEDTDETVGKLKAAKVSDYVVAYVLALRARAVAEGFAARSGEAEEEAEQTQEDVRKTESAYHAADPSLQLHIAPKGDVAPLCIFAVMDPLGKAAQRLPALLQLLHEELDAEIFLALKPQRLAEAPLTSYFRTAPVPSLATPGLSSLAAWDGHLPGVRIELAPRRGQLLSAQLNAPDAWLCSAMDSGGADLDNIRADARRGSPGAQVRVRYVVEALFLEGFAEDGMGKPGTGRQLALAPLRGTESTAGSDSVVVKSGYFQLRQTPGVFKLALHSQQAEKLVKPKGLVYLTDLAGRGSLLETLLLPGELEQDPSANLFAAKNPDSTKTFEGFGGDPTVCKETIHIFSVASGLRYERLLRIMMMSVRKHTKCPLRFWLVENFLSASFRRLLPGLAAKVGFAVSTVTYKWPTWLREQVQKQRVIWAYKILFLDVFFPAEVKRILFIDADQIVRANVQELWQMDIQGKVYGFVPFCGSGPSESLSSSMWKSFTGKAAKQEDLKNPDTVGFRFWEQGFWKGHLRDRHFYHISALFVVDLVAFRQRGAGDILRDVYQSLTADPHSLANLDQDLPNYIQANLPIHSLPQEWLWCESWCSEASKQNAKTIDMCQHPSKKEGKLQQARRIAPEWSQYDEELQKIIDTLEAKVKT